MRFAEAGIAKLIDAVDILLVIPNQNLFRVTNEKTTQIIVPQSSVVYQPAAHGGGKADENHHPTQKRQIDKISRDQFQEIKIHGARHLQGRGRIHAHGKHGSPIQWIVVERKAVKDVTPTPRMTSMGIHQVPVAQ